MDLWHICVAGPGSGSSRAVQRGVLHGSAAYKGVWDSHSVGCSTRGCSANRLCVNFWECRQWDSGWSSALSGLEHDSREVGGRQLAGSDHSPGGNASAELGIRDCLRDTGAARLRSRSNDGATLRVSAEAPVCAMDSNRDCEAAEFNAFKLPFRK